MTTKAMTCQQLVELVTEYLEDGLSAEDRVRFEEHLTVCPGCRTYLAQIEETVRLCGTLTEDMISPQAKEDLLAAFRHFKQS